MLEAGRDRAARERPAAGEPLRFVALGDSLTEGVGDRVGEGWRGWAAVLADALAPEGRAAEFTNLAYSGALTTELTIRQLPRALALRPQLAAVVVGGNDTLRTGFDIRRATLELDATMGELSGHGARLLTACLPDPGSLLRLPAPLARPLARRMRAVNTVVHALTERHRAIHLHLTELPWLAERRLLSVDRLHPSAEGHHLIALRFHDLLTEAGHPLDPPPAGRPRRGPAGPGRRPLVDGHPGHPLARRPQHRPAAGPARPGRRRGRRPPARRQRTARRTDGARGGTGAGLPGVRGPRRPRNDGCPRRSSPAPERGTARGPRRSARHCAEASGATPAGRPADTRRNRTARVRTGTGSAPSTGSGCR
ncbi:hypothetical protein GCM10010519_65850 [Streptomyces lactacystinicus]